jgi:hypothetical protein
MRTSRPRRRSSARVAVLDHRAGRGIRDHVPGWRSVLPDRSDVTGVGAVVGVPGNVASAGLIVSGGAIAGGFAMKAGQDLGGDVMNAQASRDTTGGVGDDGLGARPTRPDPSNVPKDADPYDEDLAGQVPAYDGAKTSGVVDLGGGDTETLTSRYGGPSSRLSGPPRPGTGYNNNILAHVEAHATAEMRLTGVKRATLYINRLACGGPSGARPCFPEWSRQAPH